MNVNVAFDKTCHHRLQEANFTLGESGFVLTTRCPVFEVTELITQALNCFLDLCFTRLEFGDRLVTMPKERDVGAVFFHQLCMRKAQIREALRY